MKTHGDVDMQLNTCIEKFVAAALGIMCHHYIINQKMRTLQKQVANLRFQLQKTIADRRPCNLYTNFPCGRLGSSLDTVQWSEQVKNRIPGPLAA